MIVARALASALVAWLIVPASALADEPVVCDGAGPAQVSLREGGIDAPRTACARDEVAGFARAIATIDNENLVPSGPSIGRDRDYGDQGVHSPN